MDYRFEELGPEKFQDFCQALMSKEHKNLQCFPVGQPDGGRDAIYYFNNEQSKRKFAVIQVKFVRNPDSVLDPHKWLIETLKDEAPKLKELIPKGAKSYYLITNVKGTAHLNTGSIDIVQKILDENILVPSQCLWRNDLCRKVDNAWDLKWAYPEIMNGSDFLRLVIENGLTSDGARRMNALIAFVRAQYDLDHKVKFKQVELQNNLFDLFIDGPIDLRSTGDENRHSFYHLRNLLRNSVGYEQPSLIGAATMLINPNIQKHIPFTVIEGGPGQGKSTLAQFVCQVHRVKILGDESILKNITPNYRPEAVRIPFKVDLRDFATWLGGEDPFSPTDQHITPINWHRSLEAFLAAQVNYLSGGAEFNVSDLHAISKISAILLVLDGLDEVADISRRKDIVEHVLLGVHRLKELSASLQVIVTSRPTAFANSQGFPEDEFHHFKLDFLTDNLIKEYTDKWLKAKRIYDKEASVIKKILEDKLSQPHLRELARNPMQLAVLLNLIHTRGSSLPDKRTSLYDSYIDLFFARESEKNIIVREHRDLLIDIHQFLAWKLHSEAEEGRNKGSISADRLQTVLTDYLISEDQDTSLCKTLFTGVTERVVFLVSRVEGTYEFEIQPLREYFAARYLFETAPYSPTGSECPGTRPDRFDAIARNFYWLNVTRFYAGCYSKGELPSLIDRLGELVIDDGFKNISHPRVLCSMLLSDWVFSQHQKSMKEAVKIVLDGLGSRCVLNNEGYRRISKNTLVLPTNCGRDQIIEVCIEILNTFPARDYAFEIIEILKSNTNKHERYDLWNKGIDHLKEENLLRWIEFGLYLGVLAEIKDEELEKLYELSQRNPEVLFYYLRVGRIEYLLLENSKVDVVINGVLNCDVVVLTTRRDSTILASFAQLLNIDIFELVFTSSSNYPLESLFERALPFEISPIVTIEGISGNLFKCASMVNFFVDEIKKTSKEWNSNIEPWDNIIEKSRSLWGEQLAHTNLANLAAGIKSINEKGKEYDSLFDHSVSLCRRVRHARMRYSSQNWWRKQFDEINNESDLILATIVFFTWATINTQISMAEFLESKIATLSVDSWVKSIKMVQKALDILKNTRLFKINIDDLPEKLSERIVATIGLRLIDEVAALLYLKYLTNYQGIDPVVLSFCQRASFELLFSDSIYSEHALNVVEKNYQTRYTMIHHSYSYRKNNQVDLPSKLPLSIAEKVLSNPERYPRDLVLYAELRCRQDVSERIVPVGLVAKNDNWFKMLDGSYSRSL